MKYKKEHKARDKYPDDNLQGQDPKIRRIWTISLNNINAFLKLFSETTIPRTSTIINVRLD